MTLAQFFAKMKLNQRDAEVIFDRDEPVGRPTDVVMPPRRSWFKRKRGHKAANGWSSRDSQNS